MISSEISAEAISAISSIGNNLSVSTLPNSFSNFLPPWMLFLFSGGLIAGFWGNIKKFLYGIFTKIISVNKISNPKLIGFLIDYLEENCKISPFGERSYTALDFHVKSKKRRCFIFFKSPSNTSNTYWNGIFPIFISNIENKNNDNSEQWYPRALKTLKVSFLRKTFNLEKILKEQIDKYELNNVDVNDYSRYRIIHVFGRDKNYGDVPSIAKEGFSEEMKNGLVPINYKASDIGPEQKLNAISFLSLQKNTEDVVSEIEMWKKNREWFLSKNIPWKRGYLLYGEAGTGKTSLVRAIAEQLDYPVYSYDLSSLSNQELTSNWSSMLTNTPCIALIEDIDNIFDGRKNIAKGQMSSGLTFDCLLNCLDGIEKTDGLLLFITTNKRDSLDSALGIPDEDFKNCKEISTRPGRIDRAVYLGLIDEKGIRKMAERILSDYPEKINDVVEEYKNKKITPAQFQSICTDIAVDLFWKKNGRIK